jgi:DNA-binding PadR family transcriptional regulator
MTAANDQPETPDLDQCSCAGIHLDKFTQPAVLACLTDGPLHGYALLERLKELAMFEGVAPDSTGVYRMLNSMEQRGLVESRWDTSGSGPAKKRFHLTDGGLQCLHRWLETLEDYHDRLGRTRKQLRDLAGQGGQAGKGD